jgi:hypothetical protein
MRLALLLVVLVGLGCGSSNSGGGDWSCHWTCHTDGTTGSHTYPAGANPTQQCNTDYGTGCSNFECGCTQS